MQLTDCDYGNDMRNAICVERNVLKSMVLLFIPYTVFLILKNWQPYPHAVGLESGKRCTPDGKQGSDEFKIKIRFAFLLWFVALSVAQIFYQDGEKVYINYLYLLYMWAWQFTLNLFRTMRMLNLHRTVTKKGNTLWSAEASVLQQVM